MRDPGRIDPLLVKVAELWHRYPDWRLTQLVVNVAAMGNDPFYCEDDDFERRLDERINDAARRD